MKLHISAGKHRCQFSRKKVGVGARYINVAVFFKEQAVNRFLIFVNVLYLVEEDVVHLIGPQTFGDVSVEYFIIIDKLKLYILEIQHNELTIFNTVC